nr:Rdx family protein [Euzebya tangerina]
MRVTNELLSNYQHVIDELTLITGDRGVFDVAVGGTLMYSKGQTGRQAREGEVLEALEAVLPDGTRRYGSS